MKKSLFNRCRAVIDANYVPANRMVTSIKEIDYVSKLMELEDLDKWDLQNLRDMWVMMNSEMPVRHPEYNSQRYHSVMAIIDNKMFSIELKGEKL